MIKEEIFKVMWKAHCNIDDPAKAISIEAEKIAKLLLKKDKQISDLDRKRREISAQYDWLIKDNKTLNEYIQKQHVAQPIQMFVCDKCGKEFQR